MVKCFMCMCVACLNFMVVLFQAVPTCRWHANLIFGEQLTPLCVAISNKFCYSVPCSDTVVLVHAGPASPGMGYCCGFCFAVPGSLGWPPWELFLSKRNNMQEQLHVGLLGSLNCMDQNIPWKFVSWISIRNFRATGILHDFVTNKLNFLLKRNK